MNIFLTLDYELFFGADTGTVYNSIIKPTDELIRIADKYQAKLIFFVDSGFLLKLQYYKNEYPELEKDYQAIVSQLQRLNREGHDIQLHIHPHWEDSSYDGSKWLIDTSRYRLHDFEPAAIEDIVQRYIQVLKDIVGDKIFAYRAGGWCMQPFDKLAASFKKNGIWLDSTVFKGGLNNSATHYYDFVDAPEKDEWRFETDPLIEQENGYFTEVPISSYSVSAWFYWKYALTRYLSPAKFKFIGDGQGVAASKNYLLKKLTQRSFSTVSIDGFKASFLQQAFNAFYKKSPQGNFTIIGHPKALSEYSLGKVDSFFKSTKNLARVITFSEAYTAKKH